MPASGSDSASERVAFLVPIGCSLPLEDGAKFTRAAAHVEEGESGSNLLSLNVDLTCRRVGVNTIANPLAATGPILDEMTARSRNDDYAPDFAAPDGSYTTVVVAETALVPASTNDRSEALSDAFDRCEDALVDLIRALRMSTKLRLPLPHRATLPVMVPMLVRPAGDPSLFQVSWNVPGPASPPALSAEELDRAHYWLFTLTQGHLFAAYAERYREAFDAYEVDGDRPLTLIRCQLAAEVLLDALLKSALWEEGVRPPVAAAAEFSVGLGTRVRRYYHVRFGGDWNVESPAWALGAWHRDVRVPRNRVVHANYAPSRAEARAALRALEGLDAFVRLRLADRPLTYPRTIAMLLGRPGLTRLGRSTAALDRFVEGQGTQEGDWVSLFKEWSALLDGARGTT